MFSGGDATTAFVADHAASLLDIDAEIAARVNAIAALLLRTGTDQVAATGLRHSFPVPMRFEANGKPISATLTANKDRCYTVVIDQQIFELELTDLGVDTIRFICDGVAEHAIFLLAGSQLALQFAGCHFLIDDRTLAAAKSTQ